MSAPRDGRPDEVHAHRSQRPGEREEVGLEPAVASERVLVLGVAESVVDHLDVVVGAEVLDHSDEQECAEVVVGVRGVVPRRAGLEVSRLGRPEPEGPRRTLQVEDIAAEPPALQR